MKNNDYQELSQGRRKNQLEFSYRMVGFGYYVCLLLIIGYVLYEFIK
tara:strand:- start:350 stop:490 length:141 start_codon:yes stop_codon:yes gene_type:complete